LCIRLPKLPLEAPASQGASRHAALARLALWAQQWSSHVSPQPAGADAEVSGAAADAALWLEVGGSLALFGGVSGLRAEINAALQLLGYSGELAIAPTPRAAQLLTQAPEPRAVLEPALLRARLTSLPLHWLALPEQALRALRSAGLRRIGELLALPPAALARRFGPATSLYLQRPRSAARHAAARALSRPLRIQRRSHRQHRATVSAATAAVRTAGLPARARLRAAALPAAPAASRSPRCRRRHTDHAVGRAAHPRRRAAVDAGARTPRRPDTARRRARTAPGSR